MRDFTLANLILSPNDLLREHTDLWYRSLGGSAAEAEDGSLVVSGTIDFTTYLNALSVGKWRKYTSVGGFCLQLEYQGAAFDVLPTSLGPDATEIDCAGHAIAHAEAADGWQTLKLALPIPESAIIVGFRLVAQGEVRLRRGFYYTQVNESSVREVRLAISTTTFRKEAYITRNINAIKDELFAGEELCGECHLLVVDNGRTLDGEALSDENVTVIPNGNVGGSGGFARGMMAGLDWGATHVLLMDDDVQMLPESFRRTMALLALANERYRDAFVEGAMLNLEDPNLLFEDVAQVLKSGLYGRIKGDLFVDKVEDLVKNEVIDVEQPLSYGAWWYCCIPTSVIKEQGLPLPLFVRCDDVEYGMRCKPTIMVMNGICVWHERFEGRYRSSIDSYQLTRNFLIMAAANELPASIVQAFMMRFGRTFHIYLRAMNYEACTLMLDGLEDYLKGPAFIEQADGEQILMSNNAKNEQLQDISEIDPKIIAASTPNPRYLGQGRDRGMVLKTLEMIPHDRHLLPDFLLIKQPAPAYYARGAYPARRTMARKTIVAYDQSATKAHVREMDRERWKQLRKRYRALRWAMKKDGKSTATTYRQALAHLSSREYWEEYLARHLEG
ncbi:MAG: glycosyltransferase [Coriobacteriales bacterium]|nr:glycosyltransferase [Coriobacteriales bacterium]